MEFHAGVQLQVARQSSKPEQQARTSSRALSGAARALESRTARNCAKWRRYTRRMAGVGLGRSAPGCALRVPVVVVRCETRHPAMSHAPEEGAALRGIPSAAPRAPGERRRCAEHSPAASRKPVVGQRCAKRPLEVVCAPEDVLEWSTLVALVVAATASG